MVKPAPQRGRFFISCRGSGKDDEGAARFIEVPPMADVRCVNCGAVIQTSRSKCLTCGHQVKPEAVSLFPSGSTVRGWFTSTRQPSLANGTLFASTGTASSSGSMLTDTPAKSSQRNDETPKNGRSKPTMLLLIVSLILCALVLVGGYYAIRVNRIFNTINSVSAPTGEISGEALGGSGEIKIDTGPALTAIAGGSNAFVPTEPETPETQSAALIAEPPKASVRPTEESTIDPTATSEPQQTPITTAEPRETADPTSTSISKTAATIEPTATEAVTELPAPTATATAIATSEPTTVLSQIERVKNGDFESGNDGSWHLEQGAAIDAGGGLGSDGVLTISEIGGYADQHLFFVPATEYRLSAQVKRGDKPVTGESIQVGLAYTDESGTRLTASEPAPVEIKGADWTDITFDYTPPAEAANVMIYFWKSSGASVLAVDNVSVRSIVPNEVLETKVVETSEDSMTILLMGVDARPGEAIDIGVRPDSLMVLHLNGGTGSCRVLSIPRDTRTELPGYGMTKVIHALAVGGIQYEVQVVEQLLGLEIDHYVLIDFNGFEDLVDAVGGITVDVPESFVNDDGREFVVGPQSMSGAQALSYARWRGGSDGDFGRMQRQQLILRALVSKVSGLNIVSSINELLPAVEENLRTDLSPTQMASIGTDYRSGCTESNISMVQLEGSPATYQDPLLQLPLYYVEVEPGEIRQKVAKLIEP